MRVPGNERAFTVSPARGIPFPQLVCIGAAAGQSQAFPVSARARLAAAGSWNWPARPRCRCALLYAARVERPRPPRLPASPRIHAHTLTGSHAPRGSAPLRTAALRLSLHTRAVARPWAPTAVRSGTSGGRGPETEEVEEEAGGRPAQGGLRPGTARARRPARGRRPARPGDALGAARLPEPGSELPGGRPRLSLRFPGVGAMPPRGGTEGRGPGGKAALRGPKPRLAAEWR